MIFTWDDKNLDHVGKHGVAPWEAEEVVSDAHRPYPRRIVGDRFLVWGQTSEGRYLQVIYVLKRPLELEYQSLSLADWVDIEQRPDIRIVRVINAMEMTAQMKHRLRGQRN